jgi:hypothetical protein
VIRSTDETVTPFLVGQLWAPFRDSPVKKYLVAVLDKMREESRLSLECATGDFGRLQGKIDAVKSMLSILNQTPDQIKEGAGAVLEYFNKPTRIS